jgi:hypothetical protein
MAQEKYKDATEKFRSAAGRAPEAKYYFNLCSSIYQQGVFGEALTACNAADKLNPEDKLKGKIAKLEDKIKSDAVAQHIDLNPTGVGGGGGPTNDGGSGTPPDPNGGNGGTNTMGGGTPPPQPQYAVGRPTQNLLAVAPPQHNYTWSLGVDLYGGGGTIGQMNAFGTSTGGVRFKGDYMINPPQKLGLQGYLQLTHFGEGTDTLRSGYSLDIFDLGIAAYKHVCGAARLCVTPLAGIQLAMMSPANQSDGAGSQVFNYAAFGARLEVALSYALGTRMEHVLSVGLGVNLYTKVLSEPSDGSMTSVDWGLDKGGAAGYLGLGYTYRFNTPFGQAPFVSLE